MNEDISYPIMSPSGSAPTYLVPVREVVALEHPMIIKNIDNGLKTLGTGVPVHQVSICSRNFWMNRFSG